MAHYKIVVKGADSISGEVFNVWHFNNNDSPSGVVASLASLYEPLMTVTHNTYGCVNFDVYTWSGPTDGVWSMDGADGKKHPRPLPPWGVAVPYLLADPLVGLSTSEMLPPQVAAYVFAKTVVPRDISKKYFGSMVEENQAAGVPTAALITCLTNIASYMKNGTAGCEVWGPIHGFQQITGAGYGSRLGTQRRRKASVGR